MVKKSDLKARQPVINRVALIIVLAIIIIIMVLFPRVKENEVIMRTPPVIIETIATPVTASKIETPAPLPRPSIPFPSEEADYPEEITLEPVDFGSYQPWDAPPPPPPEEQEQFGRVGKFIEFDKPPEPIGGYTAIQKNVIYPPMAQEMGIEGLVVIRAFVNKDGEVTECSVLKGMPNTGLEESAIAAIKKTRFIPAQQRDRNVGVYIAIPVVFKLKS